MAKIVNREEHLSHSFEDLISLPKEDSNEKDRKAALGRDQEDNQNKWIYTKKHALACFLTKNISLRYQ